MRKGLNPLNTYNATGLLYQEKGREKDYEVSDFNVPTHDFNMHSDSDPMTSQKEILDLAPE